VAEGDAPARARVLWWVSRRGEVGQNDPCSRLAALVLLGFLSVTAQRGPRCRGRGELGIPMEIATEKRESELAYLAGSLGQMETPSSTMEAEASSWSPGTAAHRATWSSTWDTGSPTRRSSPRQRIRRPLRRRFAIG
jgi:hypothetical protein